MKRHFLSIIAISIGLLSFPVFSQTEKEPKLLGLPGDDLDLYAVMDLFQKSKTIEDFEKSLNEEKTGINNLDLNEDKKVDFIKVETKKEGDNFKFILQDPVSETKTQNVAVIEVNKDKEQKVSLQVIGDKALYGEGFVIKPSSKKTQGVTPNPAYTGANPVKETVPSTTTTVIVETVPIVQYVYSPAYVPYYPPYYYGYYPPYYMAFATVGRAIYWDNMYDRYDDYWDDREDFWDDRNDNLDDRNENRNDRIDNRGEGATDRKTAENASAKTTAGTKDAARPTAGTKDAARPSTTPSKGTSSTARPSTTPSNSYSSSSRPTTSASTRQSSSSYRGSASTAGASRSMNSASSMSRSGGMSRGGGGRRR
jgi:hypothetical protein